MKTKFISVFLLLAGICSGCSDWLDVKPSDRISEKTAFSTVAGFEEALNGIYVELNNENLYGRALTCEFVEILAQRYAIPEENKSLYSLANYEYDGAYSKSKIESIWQKAYSLIANTNLLIKNCEVNRAVLSDDYYHLCRGEALALRGMLHFDLFRLFGPVYGASSETLPYYEEFVLDVNPSLPSDKFMGKVIDDLLNAEKELEIDPIITHGVQGDSRNVFFQYRNLRLNYYAVQALLARVYMYIGNTEKAKEYALKIIEISEKLFPWVDPMTMGTDGTIPDRMFSTEVLFALKNLNRNSIFTSLFDAQNLKLQSSLLIPRFDVVRQVFQKAGGSGADYRYKYFLSSATFDFDGESYALYDRYQGQDSLYQQMIPMLRTSEMYMIATEVTEDPEEATDYLNTLRVNRGLREISSTQVEQSLEAEWLRELYGEGQLFFYYKRKMKTEIQSAYDPYGTKTINLLRYVLPIPDGETKYN